MPKLTPQTQEARREQIITAALDCFATKGFSGTSMTDIMRQSGLSSGSIYSHFKSKDEILQATANHAFSFIDSFAEQKGRVAITPQAFYLKATLEHPLADRFGTLLQFFAEAPVNPTITEVAQRNITQIQESLKELFLPWAKSQPGDPQETTHRITTQFITLFHGYIVRTTVDPGVDRTELAQLAAELLPE